MAMTQQDYDALPAEGKEQLRKLAEAAMAFPWKDKSRWPTIPTGPELRAWMDEMGYDE